jgi:hypothetical protein
MGYFPIIVLCLTGEGFSRTLVNEGLLSAMWRGAMTTLIAVLITLLAGITGIQQFLINYPEFLITQIALIIVISEWFDLRLLSRFNPTPIKSKARKRRKKRRKLKKEILKNKLV